MSQTTAWSFGYGSSVQCPVYVIRFIADPLINQVVLCCVTIEEWYSCRGRHVAAHMKTHAV